jgi:regulator of sigma D
MLIRNKEVFVRTLSRARKNSAQSAEVYRQFSNAAESFELKRHLEKLALISENDVTSMDHFLERIGEKPVDPPFRLEDALLLTFEESCRKCRLRQPGSSTFLSRPLNGDCIEWRSTQC